MSDYVQWFKSVIKMIGISLTAFIRFDDMMA